MTHDRLVDLTTKLHEISRLSSTEAAEFAQIVGNGNLELESTAFRMVSQIYSLKDAEQVSIACKLLFGRIVTRGKQ